MPLTAPPSNADLRARLSELRAERNRADRHHEVCRQAALDYDGTDLQHSPEFRRLEEATRERDRIVGEIALLEAQEQHGLHQINNGDGARTSVDSFMNDPNAIEDLRQRAHSPNAVGDIGVGTLVSRDEWVARHGRAAAADWRVGGDDWHPSRLAVSEIDTPLTADSRSRFYGIAPQIKRPLTLLDVISTQPMDTGSFDYEREGGLLTGPAETAEGAIAPPADITLTPATATARSISAYIKGRRQQLADVATLGTVLNTRLLYAVQLRLEGQVLSGDGAGENLLGILNTSGIGAPASGAGDSNNADLVANGIAAVMAAGAVPTAVVLNPNDAIKMAKAKAGGSGERLDSPGAWSAALLSSLWGVAAVLNLGMPAGQALVGDWTIGATLFVREGVNVRVSDSDQDDFLRQRVAFLGTGRWALAVWSSACFAKVTLSFAA
jgi:hypothetical protein